LPAISETAVVLWPINIIWIFYCTW